MLVNLRMEALFVKENFNIRWVAQAGFVENINSILKEYKQSRGLLVTAIAYCFSLLMLSEVFGPHCWCLCTLKHPSTWFTFDMFLGSYNQLARVLH